MIVPGYSFIALLKSDLHKARRDNILPWPDSSGHADSISPDQGSLLDFGVLPWAPDQTTSDHPWLNVRLARFC